MTITVSGVDTLIKIAEEEGWTLNYDENADTFRLVDDLNNESWVFQRDGTLKSANIDVNNATVSNSPSNDTDVARKREVDTVSDSLSSHESASDNPHNVTEDQTGAADSLSDHTSDTTNPHNVDANDVDAISQSQLDNHTTDTTNPHEVTADDVDAIDQQQLDNHTTDTSNPHEVDANDVDAISQSQLDSHTSDDSNPHSVDYTQLSNTEHGSGDHDSSVVEDGDSNGKSLYIVNAGQFDATNFADTDIVFERE